MLARLSLLLLLALLGLGSAFQRLPTPPAFLPLKGSTELATRAQQRAALMRREVVPQIVFAAACAGGTCLCV